MLALGGFALLGLLVWLLGPVGWQVASGGPARVVVRSDGDGRAGVPQRAAR